MIALLAFFLSQVGLPFSMLAGGAAPTATPTPTATPPITQVATPVITPSSGDLPVGVHITCATAGAIIFYTVSSGGTAPSHNGATPTGSTLIFSGSFSLSGNQPRVVEALGYKAGLTDSVIATASYQPSGPGG